MEIRTHQLTKRYRGGALAADHIDLYIPGGMFGLIGANGAGKTTLMRILAGVLVPTSGKVAINGTPLDSTRHRRTILAIDRARLGQTSLDELLAAVKVSLLAQNRAEEGDQVAVGMALAQLREDRFTLNKRAGRKLELGMLPSRRS